MRSRLHPMPELAPASIRPALTTWGGKQGILALVNPGTRRRILAQMLDEHEILSPCGIRALSPYHAEHPYIFRVRDEEYRVDYLTAESNTGMFGGNSNWRGPIWFPVNALIIHALLQFYPYDGDSLRLNAPPARAG